MKINNTANRGSHGIGIILCQAIIKIKTKSYIKCLIRNKRDNKLGFNIIEGQSTIETTTQVDKGVE